MTKYNRKKISKSYIAQEKDNDRKIDEEREMMLQVAEYLGASTDEDGLAERIGWGKTYEKASVEFNKFRKDWIMKKTKNGNLFISISKVKPHKVQDKKTGERYNYGRIQILVDSEWVGYNAMVVLSKTKTPKFKVYADEDEFDIADLPNIARAKMVKNGNNSLFGIRNRFCPPFGVHALKTDPNSERRIKTIFHQFRNTHAR